MIRGGFLSAEDRGKLVALARDGSAASRVTRRANAVALLDDGWSCQEVAQALFVNDDTVRDWHKLFEQRGIEGLTSFDVGGSTSFLSAALAMERLRDKFLNVPVDAVLYPPSVSAQQAATEQKDKAAMALADEQRLADKQQDEQKAAQAVAARRRQRFGLVVTASVLGAVVVGSVGVWIGTRPVSPPTVLPDPPVAPVASAQPQATPLIANDQQTCLNGSNDDAIHACDRAISSGTFKGPALSDLYHGRAYRYFQKEDFDQSIADYKEARGLSPKKADWGWIESPLVRRAQRAREEKDFDGAIADYTELISFDPRNSEYLIARAELYKNQGDLQRAISDYDRATKLTPSSYSLFSLGNLYVLAGDLDRALSAFDEVIRIDPLSEGTMGGPARGPFNNAYHRRGGVFKAKGDLVRAAADFDQAIRMYGKWITVSAEASNDPMQKSWTYYALVLRAAAYSEKGDENRAIADYTEAIRVSRRADSYISRGDAFQRKNDLDHAIADYTEAVRLSLQINDTNASTATSASAFYRRGVACSNKGDYGHTISDFSEAIRVYPTNPEVLARRGLAFEKMSKFDQALGDFTAVLALPQRVDKSDKWARDTAREHSAAVGPQQRH
jgi:tetratricopeptide (TPR) repeat protein